MKLFDHLMMMRIFRQAVLLMILVVLLCPPAEAETIDDRLYEFLHDSYRSRMMDFFMESVTRLGDQRIILGSGLLMATYGGERERDTSKLMFTSVVGTQLVAAGLKLWVNRERPDGDHSRSNSSFPSGHATGAFAVATVLASRYEGYGAFFYAAATAVAFSRIYLGRHFPSDVAAGALLGYLGSKATLRFEKAILEFEF